MSLQHPSKGAVVYRDRFSESIQITRSRKNKPFAGIILDSEKIIYVMKIRNLTLP
jgi:hypothetical protein